MTAFDTTFHVIERHDGGSGGENWTENFQRGKALFTVGSREVIGSAGRILVVPTDTPHKFTTLGPERFESVNIHANEVFITEWLEPR